MGKCRESKLKVIESQEEIKCQMEIGAGLLIGHDVNLAPNASLHF